jgi:hypothetical protein
LQDAFVEVGLISRAHGIKGEVKVQLITDEPKKRLGTAGRRCGCSMRLDWIGSTAIADMTAVQQHRTVSKQARHVWCAACFSCAVATQMEAVTAAAAAAAARQACNYPACLLADRLGQAAI